MDGQVPAGDGVGHRVHQERHVVVDDAETHPTPAGLAAGRFEANRHIALASLVGDLGNEPGGLLSILSAEAVQFSGKGMEALRRMLRGETVTGEDVGMSAGEWREFEEVLR